jgi:hypothetical protein
MSRNEIPSRKGPECQLVVGYDAGLRLFYGQLFDHRDHTIESGGKLCIDGWPKPGGLGGTEPPILSEEEAEAALNALFAWLGPLHDLTTSNERWLHDTLKLEWRRRSPRGHENYVWSNQAGCERV